LPDNHLTDLLYKNTALINSKKCHAVYTAAYGRHKIADSNAMLLQQAYTPMDKCLITVSSTLCMMHVVRCAKPCHGKLR
jgi:hypothetical protein